MAPAPRSPYPCQHRARSVKSVQPKGDELQLKLDDGTEAACGITSSWETGYKGGTYPDITFWARISPDK